MSGNFLAYKFNCPDIFLHRGFLGPEEFLHSFFVEKSHGIRFFVWKKIWHVSYQITYDIWVSLSGNTLYSLKKSFFVWNNFIIKCSLSGRSMAYSFACLDFFLTYKFLLVYDIHCPEKFCHKFVFVQKKLPDKKIFGHSISEIT